jgi:hypothetical protein
MKRILFSLFITTSLFLNGQERINTQKNVFDAKSSAITVGKFWLYNDFSEEWESTVNNSKKWTALVGRNFISIRLNRLTIEDKTYYVLIDRYWSGYYKYPTLEVGWIDLQSVCAFTFTEEDTKKLRDIELDNELKLEVRSRYDVFFQSQWSSYTDHENILAIKRDLSNKDNYREFLRVRKTMQSGKAVIRLIIPDKMPFNDFNVAYLEIPYLEFSNLFSVVK